MCQTKTKGEYVGMFFMASTAQVFEVIHFAGFNESVINYIQLGGALEIYVFIRGSATDIVKRYHSLIGHSTMPPYYALGFFQGTDAYDMQMLVPYVLDGYS